MRHKTEVVGVRHKVEHRKTMHHKMKPEEERRKMVLGKTILRKTEVVEVRHKTEEGHRKTVLRKTEEVEVRHKTEEEAEEEQGILEWEPAARRCLYICVRATVDRCPMEIF